MAVLFEKTKLLTDKQFHTAPAATTVSFTVWWPRSSMR